MNDEEPLFLMNCHDVCVTSTPQPHAPTVQAEEEFEIDMNDEEPLFLKGVSSRSGVEMSPIKIVKNPDGSMQRAAMTQVCRVLFLWGRVL